MGPASGPPEEQNPTDDTPPRDPQVERAIREGRAPFSLWVSAYYYSRVKFNPDSPASRNRWKNYRDVSLDGKDLYGAFVGQEGEVVDIYYCEEVASAAALTRIKRGRLRRMLGLSTPNLNVVNNAPPGSDTDRVVGLALGLLDDCGDLGRAAVNYLPGRVRNQFMGELYGLTTEGLNLLDEAARRLKVSAAQVDPDANVLWEGAVDRRDHMREWLNSAARNASQFFFLRGVLLGSILMFLLAWLAASFFPTPISRHDAAWALASGGVGALVSVLIRVKTSGLVLDYQVGPLRLLLLGVIRPVLGGISGVVFLLAVLGGVIPLAQPEGSPGRVALYILGSFAAGFNERWFQDMLANVGERIQMADHEKPEGQSRKVNKSTRPKTDDPSEPSENGGAR